MVIVRPKLYLKKQTQRKSKGRRQHSCKVLIGILIKEKSRGKNGQHYHPGKLSSINCSGTTHSEQKGKKEQFRMVLKGLATGKKKSFKTLHMLFPALYMSF